LTFTLLMETSSGFFNSMYRTEIFQVGSFNNMKERSFIGPAQDWADVQYRYFPDTDALKLYFIRTVPGLIQNTDFLNDNILVDLDKNERIVVLEIKSVSSLLACDLVDEKLFPNDKKSDATLYKVLRN